MHATRHGLKHFNPAVTRVDQEVKSFKRPTISNKSLIKINRNKKLNFLDM